MNSSRTSCILDFVARFPKERLLLKTPDSQAAGCLYSGFYRPESGLLADAAGDKQDVAAIERNVVGLPSHDELHINRRFSTLGTVRRVMDDLGVLGVGGSVDALGHRQSLQHGHILVFAKQESSRLMYVAHDVYRLGHRNGDHVVGHNEDVELRTLRLQQLGNTDFGNAVFAGWIYL